MATSKIWKNRVLAGGQFLSDCPTKYRSNVIYLIQRDLVDDTSVKETLKKLVEDEKLTEAEYLEITGESSSESNN